MPMYDWECPEGHKFEANVMIADRNNTILCEDDVCTEFATRIEIGHSCTEAMLDYGLGLNREALETGRYDPEKPIQRGVRRHRGEDAGPFG